MAAEIQWGKDKDETKKKTLAATEKIDVPAVVNRPLIGRIGEFVEWIYASENELRKRYNIEKAYLKSQVAALEVYTKWARPYLIATQKLMPAEMAAAAMEGFGLSAAELASPFDVMHTYLEILGKKEVKDYGKLKGLDAGLEADEKIYSCVEIKLGFRASPGGTTERGHYTARGKAIVSFMPYVLSGKQLKELEEARRNEVLQFVDAMTHETLDAMKKDLEEYGAVPKKEEEKKEEKKKIEMPWTKHIKWTAGKIKQVQEYFKQLGIKMPKKRKDWEIELLKAAAAKKATDDAFKIYELYKKSHGMLTW